LTPKETARFIVMLAKPRMKSSGVRALNGRYAFVTVRIQMFTIPTFGEGQLGKAD
jgi:hypothetical protein